MISKINGILREIKASTAVVEVGGFCYDIYVSGWTLETIKNREVLERPIVFFTLHYIEGNLAIGNLTPRLVGFLEEVERDFFEVFTKVKGMGIRKTLNCMARPIQEIAMAVETGDTALLRQLPDIGPRTADRIVAEIKGKMTPFIQIREGEAAITLTGDKTRSSFKKEAVEILLQLGYKRSEVERMIKQTLAEEPQINKTDELVQAVFRRQ